MSAATTNKLSLLSLAMLNVAIVLNLRGLPMIADTGLTMLFFLAYASFFFLIPSALVSAELATGWPGEGGIFNWVKAAFGRRVSSTAIASEVIW